MSLSAITDFNEAATTAADFNAQKIVQANSEVLSADTNTLVEKALRRTRFLYNGGPYPTCITITQSTTNSNGLTVAADGTGRGVESTGGDSSGTGGFFLGGDPNGIGIEATGDGTGSGAVIQGGAAGVGLEVSAGGGNTNGIEAYATGTGHALSCKVGGIEFDGTQPVSTADPGANVVHATHIPKAWARITTDGVGGAVVADGLNVASVAISGAGAILTINLAGAMASTNYGVKATDHTLPAAGTARVYGNNGGASTSSAVVIFGRTITAGSVVVVDFGGEALSLFVEVTGRQ